MKSLSSYFDFHLILLGTASWISERQEQRHKLPDLMSWALNRLHARQMQRGETPTLTQQQTLLYLSQDIEAIFDSQSELPADLAIDKLIDNFWHETQFELGDGVTEYIQNAKLNYIENISELIENDENAPARDMKVRLDREYRAAHLGDRERMALEEEYANWRSFFRFDRNIVNQADEGLFFDPLWERIRDEFYEPAHRLHKRILKTNEKGERYYLISPQCGLLHKTPSGSFEPPIWCPNFEGEHKAIKRLAQEDDFVLKQTHQCRILIPGIPELWLYQELQKHPNVKQVRLYPGVDRYDLRVELISGKIDAIDVKNHRGPGAIAKILRGKQAFNTIDSHEEALIGFDNFCYLIPQAQVQGRGYPHGLSSLEAECRKHTNVYINTLEAYLKGLSNV